MHGCRIKTTARARLQSPLRVRPAKQQPYNLRDLLLNVGSALFGWMRLNLDIRAVLHDLEVSAVLRVLTKDGGSSVGTSLNRNRPVAGPSRRSAFRLGSSGRWSGSGRHLNRLDLLGLRQPFRSISLSRPMVRAQAIPVAPEAELPGSDADSGNRQILLLEQTEGSNGAGLPFGKGIRKHTPVTQAAPELLIVLRRKPRKSDQHSHRHLGMVRKGGRYPLRHLLIVLSIEANCSHDIRHTATISPPSIHPVM